jgi:hypothetical protein
MGNLAFNGEEGEKPFHPISPHVLVHKRAAPEPFGEDDW